MSVWIPNLAFLLFTLLDFLSDLFEWFNFDPIGKAVLQMIFILVFGGITYLVCRPMMIRAIERKTSLRNEDVPEWDE